MGLFLRQDGGRTELQTKLAAELQDRLKEKAAIEPEKVDPAFLDNQHQTRPAGMVIMILTGVAVVVICVLAFRVGGVF
jgi:F0F1-type ATP synthase assembly protein I